MRSTKRIVNDVRVLKIICWAGKKGGGAKSLYFPLMSVQIQARSSRICHCRFQELNLRFGVAIQSLSEVHSAADPVIQLVVSVVAMARPQTYK
jgi:hypothetical protein